MKKNFDVEKRQNSLFEASVQNALLGNESMRSAQSSILALGLAELAFLGVLLFENRCCTGLIKFLIVTLLLSYVLFIIGQIKQSRYLFKIARIFESKSNKAIEYLNKGEFFFEKEPQPLSIPKQQIKSDKITDLLILSSVAMIIFVTAVTILMVMFL